MKKKVISILIIIAIIIGVLFAIATAGTGKLFTNLSVTDQEGIGYGIGDPTNLGKYIWHMNTYDSVDGGLSTSQKNIYCLRAEYGNTWAGFTNSSSILEYNLVFDLQTERQDLLNKLVDNENDADEVLQNLLDVNGSQYREVLWLLDNMYIKDESNKEDYLAKVGIVKDEYEGVVEYYNSNTGAIYGEEVLTDADIIAIQRVAIWTFTNGEDYDKTENQNWLRITTDGSTYTLLSDSRRAMAEDLYKYLVSSAKTGASLYTADNNYTINDAPVAVNVDGLTYNNGKYEIDAEVSGSNYIVGPIVINQNNEFLYNISMTVTDENNAEIDSSKYSFTDSDGVSLEGVTLKDLVDRTEGFYIKLATSLAKSVNVQIQVTHYNTAKNLWLQGTETTSEIKLNAEQPVVEFSREEVTTTISFIGKQELIEVTVSKDWDDADNQDGLREPVTVKLLANGIETGDTVVLGQENGWTDTFENLPKYLNGDIVEYTVEEEPIPVGYADESTGVGEATADYSFTITNIHTPYTIDIPVEKVWNDNDDQDGIRPDSITVQLYADGSEVAGKKLTLTPSNSWQGKFEGLPKNANGKEIEYTIEESGVPTGYTSAITGSMKEGFTITNTYTPGTTSVKVTKVWDDNNNQDGIRPPYVTVNLLKGTQVVDTANLNEKNQWQHIFTGLPEKEDGKYITYTVSEVTQIDGYTTKITNDNLTSESGDVQTALAPEYTITNEHETEETSITVLKIWDDENNQDKIRPDSVVVNIKNGNTIVDTVTLSNINNWTHTFEGLPTNNNGIPISYTIEEIEPNGYTANIEQDENDKNKYIITNTHIPEKIFDLSLRKYITKINNNELTTLGLETRVPNISEVPLKTGTTASYRHRKDPVEVEENDIITYAITIYNEGEKAGYASKIIDQLPEGLIYNPSTQIVSKDANGVEKNTYEVTYESSTNRVIFNIVNTEENPAKELQPYEEGNLDSETIEIKCKVIYRAKAGESNILTNVAWINEAYNAEDEKIITTTVGDDRDSEPGNAPNVSKDNMEDYKGNTSNLSDLSNSDYFYEGQQDDDDFEKIYVKTFDLSLRKFISLVNGKELEDSREPQVDITPLQNGTGTTAIYNHPKTPVGLKAGDTVVYTIRIYNEGEIDGFANEVKDYLPPYLEYVENSTINNIYKWSISEDGRIATTTYLENKEILAFNGTELDYEDIQIECKVLESAIPNERITNIAEISEYKYGDTIYPEDVDSKSDSMAEDLPEDENLPDYKEENEDDDDFEKVYVKEFDLSLKKFITQVQDREITSRIPQVKNENGVLLYEHSKEVLTVHVGEVVTYTIRVYNEGEIDGYASEITDDIPEYLEYLPEHSTNVEYMWKMYDENENETEKVEEAVKVTTTYLSKENGENNLLTAFDGNTLYYRDIKIAFRVKDPNSNTQIITNHAQISDDTDEDGNEIKDKDSYTDEWNEGEDDQDIENIKVEYFDLSILKFVSKIIIQENGTEKITETGYNGHEDPEPVVKVELHKKELDDVIVKFGYGVTITNEGDMPGYATEITDYIPEGLKFESVDNPQWTDEGNNVISTKQLENTLLQPGESKTIEVILTWINDPDNMALKTNTVEISEDKNEYNVPDRDSIPDNKQEGEDDIDIAKAILAIVTGNAKTYFSLTLGLLAIIATGLFLIKRFVI